ncbi:MAG: kynureninase [Acidobacteriota bacterium]|nr:kynureninase [Acidobacteriota bacterium]
MPELPHRPLRDADLADLDRRDPLAPFRRRFRLPEDAIYLDGNSLGPLPTAVPERLNRVIEEEWGRSLIRGWNDHDWIGLPLRVGEKIGRLIGAESGEVVVTDSTSVNLFKLLAAALKARPGRSTVLVEEDGFPTDTYMVQGLLDLVGGHRLRRAPAESLEESLDDDVAVMLVGHVHYRSGALRDLHGLTAAAHRHGALALWDLAHSAGAVPVELAACGVDLAVGCGYKFLNGGPGAPAFLYVARRLQKELTQPLSGWLGHADPFAFEADYRPAPGIARHLCGTPPILSMAALDTACDLLLEADLEALRAKSLELGAIFQRLVQERCAGLGLKLAGPEEPWRRGSQISWRHPKGYAVVRALVERGVIPDFRGPDVIRCGLAPLYLRYTDLGAAVDHLRQTLEEEPWRRPELRNRHGVP